jgi:hypothetical protein
MTQMNRPALGKRTSHLSVNRRKGKGSPRPFVLSKEQLAKYAKLRRILAEWTEEDANLTEDTWPELEKQLNLNGMSYRTRGHA